MHLNAEEWLGSLYKLMNVPDHMLRPQATDQNPKVGSTQTETIATYPPQEAIDW